MDCSSNRAVARRRSLLIQGLRVALGVLVTASLFAPPGYTEVPVVAGPGPVAYRLQRLSLPSGPQPVVVDLDLEGERVRLDLRPSSNRSEHFQVLVQEADGGLRRVTPPASLTYRGTVEGKPGSIVGATIRDRKLSAAIALDATTLFYVQPAGEEGNDANPFHVVYRVEASAIDSGACPVHEPAAVVTPPPPGSVIQGGPRVADLAVDADFEFFTLNGSSVNATVTDIENLMNAVNVIYQRDCELSHRLATVIVRSAEPDPYTSTDVDVLLDELETHWNTTQSGVSRDMVHLMTGKELDGGTIGYAAVGVVCNRNRAYGLSQARYTTNLGRRSSLVSHELGHNWNAVHCDAEVQCNIMCSFINGCDGLGLPNFEPTGAQDIRDFAATRTCLDSPPMAAGDQAGTTSIRLAAPQPSPFRGETRLRYFLSSAGTVRLSIFDVTGHRVARLVEGVESAGWHTVVWTGRGARGDRLGPGEYYARLEARGETTSQKLLLVP